MPFVALFVALSSASPSLRAPSAAHTRKRASREACVSQPTPRGWEDTRSWLRHGGEARRDTAPRYDAEATRLSFSPSGRWLVLSRADSERRTFVELREGTALSLEEPLASESALGQGTHFGAAPDADGTRLHSESVRLDPTETRALYEGPEGLRVVHLRTGQREYEWSGAEASHALFSPKGSALAWIEWTAQSRVYVLHLETGALRVYPVGLQDGRPLRWLDDDTLAWIGTDRSVRVLRPARASEGDAYRSPERELEPEDFAFSPSGAHLAVSYRARGFALFHAGASAPHYRAASAWGLPQWEPSERRLLWNDLDEEPLPSGGGQRPSVFHVVNTESGAEVRVRGVGACSYSAETAERLEGDTLVSNTECSSGCLSTRQLRARNFYDLASGALLREGNDGDAPSYAEQQYYLGQRVAQARRRAGNVEEESLVLPDESAVLLRTPSGLRVAPLGDDKALARAAVSLPDSDAQALRAVALSRDGSLFAGVDARGVARAWSTADGRLRWASNR